MPQAPPPPNCTEATLPRAPRPPHYQTGAAPTTPHRPGPQRVSKPTAGMDNPQRHAPVGRNHTGAPGHQPPLNQGTHQRLGTTGGPPPTSLHHPRGCRHHTNVGRLHNSGPRPRRPHTPTNVVGTHDSAPRPHAMGSYRHHLPRPQRPHTHLARQVGGHPWRPPPGTTRTHAHPLHPLPGARSSPSTTRHTHPGALGIHHTHKPISSGGHQDRTFHPASPDPNPTAQHPTRLHHLVGISRPRQPHPPTRLPPPRHQHQRPPPGCSTGSHPGRGPGSLEPTIPGRDQSSAARKSRRKTPCAETAPSSTQTRHDGTHSPRRMHGPLHHPPHQQPQKRRRQDHRHPPPPPHNTGV